MVGLDELDDGHGSVVTLAVASEADASEAAAAEGEAGGELTEELGDDLLGVDEAAGLDARVVVATLRPVDNAVGESPKLKK